MWSCVCVCVCLLILVQNHWCEDIWNDPNNFKGYFKGTVTPKMYMFMLWWGWRLEASMHSLEHNGHKPKQCIWNQRNSRTFDPGTLVWAGLCRSSFLSAQLHSPTKRRLQLVKCTTELRRLLLTFTCCHTVMSRNFSLQVDPVIQLIGLVK